MKKEKIYEYEKQHDIPEENCLVHFNEEYGILDIDDDTSDEDIDKCYEAILNGNAADYYGLTGTKKNESDNIFSDIVSMKSKMKKVDIDDIFKDELVSETTEEESVSESDTLKDVKSESIEPLKIKVRIRDNNMMDEACYSMINLKKAVHDMYDSLNYRTLFICFPDYESEVISITGEDEIICNETSYKNDEEKNCIYKIQATALAEVIKIQRQEFKKVLSEDELADKLKKEKIKRAECKKILASKKISVKDVYIKESFAGFDMSSMDFSGYMFIDCEFDDTNLSQCIFINSMFIGCDLSKAKTKEAVFENTKFYKE